MSRLDRPRRGAPAVRQNPIRAEMPYPIASDLSSSAKATRCGSAPAALAAKRWPWPRTNLRWETEPLPYRRENRHASRKERFRQFLTKRSTQVVPERSSRRALARALCMTMYISRSDLQSGQEFSSHPAEREQEGKASPIPNGDVKGARGKHAGVVSTDFGSQGAAICSALPSWAHSKLLRPAFAKSARRHGSGCSPAAPCCATTCERRCGQ